MTIEEKVKYIEKSPCRIPIKYNYTVDREKYCEVDGNLPSLDDLMLDDSYYLEKMSSFILNIPCLGRDREKYETACYEVFPKLSPNDFFHKNKILPNGLMMIRFLSGGKRMGTHCHEEFYNFLVEEVYNQLKLLEKLFEKVT